MAAATETTLCAYVRWSMCDPITGAGRLNDRYADRLARMAERDASASEGDHIARLIGIDYALATVDDLVAWATLPTHALCQRAGTLFGGRLLKASNSLMREAAVIESVHRFMSVGGLVVLCGSDPTTDRIPHLVRGLDADSVSAILRVPKGAVALWLSGAGAGPLLVDAAASPASRQRLIDWIDEGLAAHDGGADDVAHPSFAGVFDAEFYLTTSGGGPNAILWANVSLRA